MPMYTQLSCLPGALNHTGRTGVHGDSGKVHIVSKRDTQEARSNKIETSERNECVQAAINFHPSNGVLRVTVMCTEQMSYYAHTILPLSVIYKRCTRTHTHTHSGAPRNSNLPNAYILTFNLQCDKGTLPFHLCNIIVSQASVPATVFDS